MSNHNNPPRRDDDRDDQPGFGDDDPAFFDLDRPVPAVFAAPDDWWRELVDGLDEDGRRELFAGEYTFGGFADDGGVKVTLVVPERLRAELEERG